MLALWIDLACVRAAEALEWLHSGRKSGFLRLAYRDHRKAVYLREGEVVFASSNQRIDRLGPCLARQGVLSLDELHAANRDVRPDERFGKTLVTRGYLEPRHLWDGIRGQLEEIVWSITAYRDGVLAFWEGEVSPDNLVRIDFDTRGLLARGAEWRRALDEWSEGIRASGVRIRAAEGDPATGVLESVEAHVLDSLAGEAGFEDVCRRTGLDPLTVARTLHLLEDARLVEIERPEEDPESTLRAHHVARAEETHRRLVAANQCIEAMMGSLGPLAGHPELASRARAAFEDIAARFPGAVGHVALSEDLLLPVDDLEKRLREADADLWSDVLDAVGALLEYLEFEVVNHPGLDDPETLLRAIRPFRELATR